MNAERLHALALSLNRELNATKIVTKLDQLCQALETLVNQQHAQYQEALANALTAVRSALEATPSDGFSPAWRQLLQEIGGVLFFGQTLKAKVDDIFQRNQITPAVALKELKELHKQVQAFKQAIDQVLSAFKLFGMGNEELEPGECEIGMLVPRAAVDNKLSEFADELNELSFILNTFSEVATGKPSDLSIKTISSSDLTVYLKACIPFAACLAVAIERTVALYKQLLEVKKLRTELLRQGVPEKQTVGIEEHANNLMESGINDLSVEIVDRFYTTNDGGRKHELTNAVRVSLRRIADRIDRGYNLEVRVEPLTGVEASSDSGKADDFENIQTIQAASRTMQFLKTDGPPILRLSDGKNDGRDGQSSKRDSRSHKPTAKVDK